MQDNSGARSGIPTKGAAFAAFRGSAMLIFAGIAWWAAHYCLLWDSSIAVTYGSEGLNDARFAVTLLGTVITLAALSFAAHARPTFFLASHAGAYIVYAACCAPSLALMFLAEAAALPHGVGLAAAFLSGVGNSFALVFYGELHERMGRVFEPLVFALEMVAGIVLSALLSQLRLPVGPAIACVCVIVAAVLFWGFACKSQGQDEGAVCSAEVFREPDATMGQIMALAALTGFAYGLMRTFAFEGVSEASSWLGFSPERLGSILGVCLLAALYFLQRRQSLMEQVLLFVIPVVATGLLLISLQGGRSVAPITVNTGGFACFFSLLWYFAAVFASGRNVKPTLYIALLFFASQFGQLVGAIIPVAFSNTLSTALVYALLLVTTLIMYWRSRSRGVAAQMCEAGQACATEGNVLASTEGDEGVAVALSAELGLSPREAEVAMLLARRIPYRQIADRLYVSENTIKTHARNIYKKAGVTSREELLTRMEDLAKKV